MTHKLPTFWNTESFDKYFIGSDQLHKTLKQTADFIANTAITNYPPYNIKKVEDNKYVIEMAVAGFAKQDIEMTLEQNKLVIKGQTKSDVEDKNYIFKGIADRGFARQFTLADNVVIDNAQLINGMLKVWLDHVIPESQKPKKIDIQDASEEKTSKKSKTFLTE